MTKVFLLLACAALPASPSVSQKITPAPAGPFHITGNQIIDSKGRVFLMRGTQLTEFRPQTVARDTRAALDYGPHSATSLAAIRLRFNMNTVRVPLTVQDGARPDFFPELAKLVRRVNESEMLAIIAPRESGAVQFWSRCAAFFKDNPNVMFDVQSDAAASVRAIRAAGARQPIIARSATPVADDPNIIYEFSQRFIDTRTDADRDARFSGLAARVPVMATGWDLELDDQAACSSIPADPAAVSALVQGYLDYFDAHAIHWSVSVFEPGKLVKDLADHDATSLENGWTCGKPIYPAAGLGRIVQGHLRAAEERGLFVVGAAGGLDIPRGGFGIAYGPVMAERDSRASGSRLPVTLGKVSVQVTDSRGVTRPAGLLWVSAGWGQVNFVIPDESATGPARMNIVRADGSNTAANITITDTAPGLWTGVSCRGAASGYAIRGASRSPISSCVGWNCKTMPIAMTGSEPARVLVQGSGFRHAKSASSIHVTIGGVRVPVVSFGPTSDSGIDELTIEIPPSLQGSGELDLICHLNGRVSNPVRIRVGGAKPVS